MKIKHIIWDWNGTLFNDLDLSYILTHRIVAEYGGPSFTKKDLRKACDHPAINIYKTLHPDFNEADFPKLAKDWYEDYQAKSLEYQLFSDSISALEKISDSNISQSIVSALNGVHLVNIVERFELMNYFTHVDGLRDLTGHSKVELALTQFAKLHIEANEAVVIGDTLHDLEVAEEIGAHCILIRGGYDCGDKLEKSSAPVVNTREEALKLVTEI